MPTVTQQGIVCPGRRPPPPTIPTITLHLCYMDFYDAQEVEPPLQWTPHKDELYNIDNNNNPVLYSKSSPAPNGIPPDIPTVIQTPILIDSSPPSRQQETLSEPPPSSPPTALPEEGALQQQLSHQEVTEGDSSLQRKVSAICYIFRSFTDNMNTVYSETEMC